jgi:glycogen debranching enzyme
MATEAAPLGEEDWLPVGEEPFPRGSITHLVVLRSEGVSALSLPSGDIDARTEPSTGVFYRDTRYLSRLVLSFGGVRPVLLDNSESEYGLSAIFTNPAIHSRSLNETVPAQSLVVRRRRVLAGGLVEGLTISNYGRSRCEFELRVGFDADFADIFEIRGYARRGMRNPVRSEIGEGRVTYSYHGADGLARQAMVAFSHPPDFLGAYEAGFLLRLDPGETTAFDICASIDGDPLAESVPAVSERLARDEREWMEGLTSIETDHESLNQAFERSLLDIWALRTAIDGKFYVAAGVPWFDTLFGRDSLIAGMELAAVSPEILRWALLVLAEYQARETDLVHDASPGKLPHELRWGELANAGEVPFGRYYGSVDVTPLFILAAEEYLRWTGDEATVAQLWGTLERALGWCTEQLGADPHGFLSYARVSAVGLENQGWKDSHDAIVWPDGRLVDPPIALIEVQGYMVAAFRAFGRLAAALGRPGGPEAASAAEAFTAHVDGHFADEELGYALCLDGHGKPVSTPASNPGQLLWAHAARPDLAATIAARLMQPDMFSGWGVRTLGTRVPSYNPLGYHLGSVWPHDNALFLGGLRAYGFDAQAARLGAALVDMALAFPAHRVPELFSGDPREMRSVPTPYPVASRPQAWAAACVPYILTSMLGIRPGVAGQLCVVRPMLPPHVNLVRVKQLRFRGGSVDLAFRRQGERVGVEVEDIRGGLEVVLSMSGPDVPR